MIPDYKQERGQHYVLQNPTDVPKNEDEFGSGVVQKIDIKKADFGSAIRTQTLSEHERMDKAYKKDLKLSMKQAKRDAILRGQIYIPKSPDSRHAYNEFTSDLSQILGPVTDEVLHQTAYDLITLYRTKHLSDNEITTKSSQILDTELSYSEIKRLIDFAHQMTDFQTSLQVQEMQDAQNDDGIISLTAEMDAPMKSSDESESSDEEQELPFNIPLPDTSGGWTMDELQKFCEENFGAESQQKVAEIMSALQTSDGINLEMQLVCIIGPRESEIKAISRSKHLLIKNPQKQEKYSTIDLDTLTDKKESTRLSSFEMPKSATVESTDKYEKIYIPPPITHASGERLSVEVLDEKYQKLIAKEITSHGQLNLIQSIVYPQIENSSENLLISAPTGAGKTIIAVLSMIKTLLTEENSKVIYIAPMKSLVQEMVTKFTNIFEGYKRVIELTGDSSASVSQLQNYDIIVSTPEKLDIISRKTGNSTFIESIKLVIIDEIHLLHNSRGPVLEALVARLKMLRYTSANVVRLIGLSATMPNVKDIADFLEVSESGLFVFGEEYRPCLLHKTFVGFKERKKVHLKSHMNDFCYKVIKNLIMKDQQTLVFVHSRREAMETAQAFYDIAMKNGEGDFFANDKTIQHLESIRTEIVNEKLKGLIATGFAFHHAGLLKDDRRNVEEGFRKKYIKVLVSTATLAWGVNLPAHTAIIKGTNIYNPEIGDFDNLSHLDVLQMFGRAGRPSFDLTGEAFLLTEHQNLHYYVSALTSQIPIESHFLRDVANHLNAEISLGTIRSVEQGVEWLKETFLYIRMQRMPKMYGLSHNVNIIQRLSDIIHSAALKLSEKKLVLYNAENDTISATDFGRIAANYYITEETMSNFVTNMSTDLNDVDMLRLFCLATGFKNVVVRPQEVSTVRKFLETVPIPIKGQPDEAAVKINVLLQCYISRIRSDSFEMMADLVYISQSAERLMRCLFEIAATVGLAEPALLALSYSKMVSRRMWEVQNPLWQFDNIADRDLLAMDHFNNWHNFYNEKREVLAGMGAQRFSALAKVDKEKSQQIGEIIKADFMMIPQLTMNCQTKWLAKKLLKVNIDVDAYFNYDPEYHLPVETFWVFVINLHGDEIMYHEQFVVQAFENGHHNAKLEFVLSLNENQSFCFVKIVSDRWVNCEVDYTIPLRFMLDDNVNAQSTEAKRILSKTNDGMNIDFTSLISKNNILYTTHPYNTGIDDDFTNAVLSFARQNSSLIIIPDYEKFCYYRDTAFSNSNILSLSGDYAHDKLIMQSSQSVIATPTMISDYKRFFINYESAPLFRYVFLYDLHLAGTKEFCKYESLVTTIKIVCDPSQTTIVAQSLNGDYINCEILANWIHADKIFDKIPDQVAERLPILCKFPTARSRQVYMTRSSFFYATKQSNQTAIVFVSSDDEIKKTFINYVELFRKSDEDGSKYYNSKADDEDLPPIHSQELKELSLQYGITYFSNKISQANKEAVIRSFEGGNKQIIICSADSASSLNVKADVVIVQGTEYKDIDDVMHKYQYYEILNIIAHTKCGGQYIIFTHDTELQKLMLGQPIESFIESDSEAFINTALFNYALSTSARLLQIADEPNLQNAAKTIFDHLEYINFAKSPSDPVFDESTTQSVLSALLDVASSDGSEDEDLIEINNGDIYFTFDKDPEFNLDNTFDGFVVKLIRFFRRSSLVDIIRQSLTYLHCKLLNFDEHLQLKLPKTIQMQSKLISISTAGQIAARHNVSPDSVITMSSFAFKEHPLAFIASLKEVYSSIDHYKYIGESREAYAQNESIDLIKKHLVRFYEPGREIAKRFQVLSSIMRILSSSVELYSLASRNYSFAIFCVNYIACLTHAIEDTQELLQFPHFTQTVLDAYAKVGITNLNTFNPSYSPTGEEIDDEQFESNRAARKNIFLATFPPQEQQEGEKMWGDVENAFNNIPDVSCAFNSETSTATVSLYKEFSDTNFEQIPFKKTPSLWIIIYRDDQTIVAAKNVVLMPETSTQNVSFPEIRFDKETMRVVYYCDSYIGCYSCGEAEIDPVQEEAAQEE